MENAVLGGRGKALSPYDENAALATDVFDHFCSATTLKSILGLYRHMCDLLKLRPTNLPHFYPKVKSKLRSWKAQALWKRLDIRANHKCYGRGRACASTRVLVIGAGPCGLRAAIECQLLGAKVVVIEKRDRLSRNNVLHLWPFVIHDLRALGAKKFFGKFCAGAIDHISIRQLQCILLKVALLLGVEIHESVGFESLVEPTDDDDNDKFGWRANVSPADHPASQYVFDVLIGADGKRNTLDGFKRKEFRGKLAIAITANFINKHSEAEARVQEISGVAFIFNQKFFKDLYSETGIDLENIVYYKDETHYFVMTAKKHSLLDKGVILQDLADTARLLAQENVDREALMKYAREAADFSTNYQLPNLEFAVNHYGQPDVAMFDFTSMYAAENASRVVERKGHRLLMCLVGDSLLEPFWPTGSGCARGFLSCLDACWAVRAWGSASAHPLEVVAERESIYRLLGQTTPENLQRDYASYTLCPSTRYPNLNRFLVTPIQVRSLYDLDKGMVELPATVPNKSIQDKKYSVSNNEQGYKKKRKRDTQVHPDTLLHWIQKQVAAYSVRIDNISSSFKNGLALCAIIHRYRPELIDWNSLKAENMIENNQLAFDILEKEIGIPPVMTGVEIAESSVLDKLTMLSYLSQIYDAFHGEIPQTIKHSKIDMSELKQEKKESHAVRSWKTAPDGGAGLASGSLQPTPRTSGSKGRVSHLSVSERRRKRRSADKAGEERENEIISNRNDRMNKRRQNRKNATEQFYKSIHMLHTNAKWDDGDSEPFEDYSIYLYRQTAPDFGHRVKELEQKLLNPDRDRYHDYRNISVGGADENFGGRLKTIEQKFKHRSGIQEKKPPDLLRAIGKIESSDWNVREIEKKIMESKLGKNKNAAEKEKVPKWNREQFVARQSKMEKKSNLDRQDSVNEKYQEIDKSLQMISKKLKEGSTLEQGPRGNNKVASMAEQFDVKSTDSDSKISQLPKSSSKTAISLPAKGGSEICHFCGTRVYVMERLSAEGRFFHRGCFRCQYCSINLRLGFYVFDAQHGNKFYCPQHAGMQGKTRNMHEKKPFSSKVEKDSLDAKMPSAKGHTPERIEFANLMQSGHVSESEEPPSVMDEDEWTDRNFGQSTAELDSSDLSDSDSDDIYEEALERAGEVPLNPLNSGNEMAGYMDESPNSDEDDSSDDESSYYDYSSDADENDSVTDEEEIKLAREIRRREFNVQERLIPADTDTTGSDTEVIISKLDTANCTNLSSIPENIQENPTSNESSNYAHTKEGSIVLNNDENEAPNQKLDNFNAEAIQLSSDENLVHDLQSDNSKLEPKLLNIASFDNIDKPNITDSLNSLDKENLFKSDIPAGTQLNIKNEENTLFLSEDDPCLTQNNPDQYLTVNLDNKDKISDDDSFTNLLESVDIPSDVDLDFLEEIDRAEKAIKVKEELKEKKLLPSQLLAMRSHMNERKLRERRNSVDPQYSLPTIVKPPLKLDSEIKKYFGENLPNKIEKPKPKKLEIEDRKYSFEPNDDDLNEVEDLIENLMAVKDISEIPVPSVPKSSTEEKEDDEDIPAPFSDSLEDLFKALETETTLKTPITDVVSGVHDEKLSDLLNFLDDLDHTPLESKLYRSYSGAKYSKLEKHLKSGQKRTKSVVSKMPRQSIEMFENMITKSDSKTDIKPVELKITKRLSQDNIDIFECNRRKPSFDKTQSPTLERKYSDVSNILKKTEKLKYNEPSKSPINEKQVLDSPKLEKFDIKEPKFPTSEPFKSPIAERKIFDTLHDKEHSKSPVISRKTIESSSKDLKRSPLASKKFEALKQSSQDIPKSPIPERKKYFTTTKENSLSPLATRKNTPISDLLKIKKENSLSPLSLKKYPPKLQETSESTLKSSLIVIRKTHDTDRLPIQKSSSEQVPFEADFATLDKLLHDLTSASSSYIKENAEYDVPLKIESKNIEDLYAKVNKNKPQKNEELTVETTPVVPKRRLKLKPTDESTSSPSGFASVPASPVPKLREKKQQKKDVAVHENKTLLENSPKSSKSSKTSQKNKDCCIQ